MLPIDSYKPYRISFEHRPAYLYAYVEGEKDSVTISLAYWREIAGECARLKCTKILIEEDIADMVSMTDMYTVAAEIPSMFYGVTLAFVDRYADQNELNEFGELVAVNRGIHGKLFADIGEAEKWLLAR